MKPVCAIFLTLLLCAAPSIAVEAAHPPVVRRQASISDNVDPVGILREARGRFETLRTYTCRATSVYKAYQGKKEITHSDVVQYYFQKPKNIRMKWLSPWNIKGQVAVYSDDQLKVKLNWLPVPFALDPKGGVAKDANGNRIFQTDMGALIKQLTDIMDTIPETVVKYEGTLISKNRQVIKISMKNREGLVYAFIDKELRLPVVIEHYDAANRMVEAAYFEELQVNVQMSPYEFILD